MTALTESGVSHAAGDSYHRLVREFPLRHIRSREELDRANAVIEALISRPLDPDEQDYLDLLCDVVEKYEDMIFPERDLPDARVVEFLMEQNDLTQADLAKLIGVSNSTVCDILAGRRKFTRAQLGAVAGRFKLPMSVFSFK